MKKRRLLCVLLVLSFCVALLSACGEKKEAETTEQVAGTQKRDVSIGCFNTGEYDYWHDELDTCILELQNAGAISGYEDRPRDTMAQIWEDVCKCQTDNLHFVADAYYEQLYMTEEELAAALGRTDVDVMICLGTTAGAYLTEHIDECKWDYLVVGSADPISAGIVKSETERLNDQSFAVVDAGRYGRQIEAAWEMFRFRSIGVVYEDRPDAYAYSGIDQLKKKAKEHGFEIFELHVAEVRDDSEKERYYRELKEAYRELSGKVDAMYITAATTEDKMLPWLLEDFVKNRVVTISQSSESQVEHGVIMHVKVQDAIEEGQFLGQTLISYGNGVPVTELNMKFEIAPRIYLNQEAIRETGLKVPFSTYLIADEIYREVKRDE